MKRPLSMLVAAVMTVTGTTSFTPAMAMPAAPAVTVDAGTSAKVLDVRDRRIWPRHRHHYRHSYRHRAPHYRYYGYRHRHHHHHDGAAVALGIIGGLAAGAILSQPSGSSWAAACARKYRSFDWSTGTYLGYDGYRHRCVLP